MTGALFLIPTRSMILRILLIGFIILTTYQLSFVYKQTIEKVILQTKIFIASSKIGSFIKSKVLKERFPRLFGLSVRLVRSEPKIKSLGFFSIFKNPLILIIITFAFVYFFIQVFVGYNISNYLKILGIEPCSSKPGSKGNFGTGLLSDVQTDFKDLTDKGYLREYNHLLKKGFTGEPSISCCGHDVKISYYFLCWFWILQIMMLYYFLALVLEQIFVIWLFCIQHPLTRPPGRRSTYHAYRMPVHYESMFTLGPRLLEFFSELFRICR